MKSPLNILWDLKDCIHCKKQFCPRIPEHCAGHNWAKKHQFAKHHPSTSSIHPRVKFEHKGREEPCHSGKWEGFLHGWTCCKRGKGHTSYNREPCDSKHVCDSTCGFYCESCGRLDSKKGCVAVCSICGSLPHLGGCTPFCSKCHNHHDPIGCVEYCISCNGTCPCTNRMTHQHAYE